MACSKCGVSVMVGTVIKRTENVSTSVTKVVNHAGVSFTFGLTELNDADNTVTSVVEPTTTGQTMTIPAGLTTADIGKSIAVFNKGTQTIKFDLSNYPNSVGSVDVPPSNGVAAVMIATDAWGVVGL